MDNQIYKVRDPSGAIREISGPAGASDDEVIARAKELFATEKPVADDQSWGKVASDAASNFIPSLANMVKGVAGAIAHPIDTASGVVDIAAGGLQNALPKGVVDYINKTFPSASAEEARAKADAVGKFYVDRYGSMEGFKKALGQDPAGVMADATTVLSAGGALVSKVPGLASTGAALTKAGRAVDPLLQTTRLAGKAIPAVGKVVADVVGGIGTHTGGEAIRQVAGAGFEGGAKAAEAARYMRDKAPIINILDDAKMALSNIRAQRSAEYTKAMQGVSADKTVLNFSDIDNAVNRALAIKTFKGKSISPTTSKVQQDIVALIDDWKKQNPAEFHTAEGLDALKQAVGDIRDAAEFGTPSRKVAETVYSAIRGEVAKQAPEYSKIMGKYSEASDLIYDIEKSLTGNDKTATATAMKKLLRVMSASQKNNAVEMGLAKELEKAGAKNLLSNLAAVSLQGVAPRGLAGQAGIGLGGLGILAGNPLLGGGFLTMQSPRIMGEAALKIGQGAGLVDKGIRSGKGLLGGGINFPLDNYLYQANRLNTVSEEEQQ